MMLEFLKIVIFTFSYIIAGCVRRRDSSPFRRENNFIGGLLMEVNKNANCSVLQHIANILVSHCDKRRIRKCAEVLSKGNMYEAYFVQQLSDSDLALLSNLIREELERRSTR